MWIHQRTGENTAVSYGLGTAIFGGLVLAGIAAQVLQQAWPFLVAALIAYVAYLLVRHYGERSKTAERLAQRFRERD